MKNLSLLNIFLFSFLLSPKLSSQTFANPPNSPLLCMTLQETYQEYLKSKYGSKDDSTKLTQKIRYKNPYLAGGLAIFPGFLMRGIGHYYAGRKKTWWLLMPASYFCIAISWNAGWGSDERTSIVFFGLFLGIWAVDIIRAPILCIQHNKKLYENVSIKPYMRNSLYGNQYGMRLDYRF